MNPSDVFEPSGNDDPVRDAGPTETAPSTRVNLYRVAATFIHDQMYTFPLTMAVVSTFLTLLMIALMVLMTILHHVSFGSHQDLALVIETLLQDAGSTLNLFREAAFLLAWLSLYWIVLSGEETRAVLVTAALCLGVFNVTKAVVAFHSITLWYGPAIQTLRLLKMTKVLVGCLVVRAVCGVVLATFRALMKPKRQ